MSKERCSKVESRVPSVFRNQGDERNKVEGQGAERWKEGERGRIRVRRRVLSWRLLSGHVGGSPVIDAGAW